MKPIFRIVPLAALLLGACTVMPTGPSVMVLPGTGKSFDQFRADDYMCRDYANAQIGGATAQQAATQSGVTSAAVGTLVGAAAGAAIGGREGAAVGAGTGLAAGALAGTGTAQQSGYDLQWRYDMAYTQCMYARGHRVPVSGSFETAPASGYEPAPPPPPPPPSTR